MYTFYDEVMIFRKFFLLSTLFFAHLYALPLVEQFKQKGYVEIFGEKQDVELYNALYASFDRFLAYLQDTPIWRQKLYSAKERFIRSKEQNLNTYDFFGLYDDEKRKGASQISFYYSTHFHNYFCACFPECQESAEITEFLDACFLIQERSRALLNEKAQELGIETAPSILFKVIKYLPEYSATRPHYDGTLFSLFLDSTDNESILLSPYKDSFSVDDFITPRHSRDSILLIPGVLLTELSIYPTPHIVIPKGKIRYSAVAFAMKQNHRFQKVELADLPNFITK